MKISNLLAYVALPKNRPPHSPVRSPVLNDIILLISLLRLQSRLRHPFARYKVRKTPFKKYIGVFAETNNLLNELTKQYQFKNTVTRFTMYFAFSSCFSASFFDAI